MARTVLVISSIVMFFVAGTAAGSGPFGLGIIIGEPTGICGKLYLTKGNAIDGAIAWSLEGDNDFHIHGDYLYHNYTVLKVETGELPIHFGIGGRIKFRENQDDRAGVRFPVGVDYIFSSAPFEIFLEVVPIMDLTPDTDFDMNAAIGGRFFF